MNKPRDLDKLNKSASSMVLDGKTKGKVNSSRDSSKFPSHSLGGMDNRLSASMQVIGNHVRRDLGSASSTRSLKTDRSMLERRSHTSLGFTWNTNPLAQPSNSSVHKHQQGFDLAAYVKRCGTAQGIQIGVNGRLVDMDVYLAKVDASTCNSSESEEDDVDVQGLRSVSEGSLLSHRVPLSWADQLELAEPKSILSSHYSKKKKDSVIIQDKSKEENSKKNFELMLSKLSVTLSWKETCVLDSTPLAELNPSLTLPVSPTDQSWTDLERGNTLQPPLPGSEKHVTKLRRQESIDKSKLEEPITPVIDVMSEFSSSDLLGIWFNTQDGAVQKELVKLSFEVFVTTTKTTKEHHVELSTKAFTKLSPQIVSKTVSVIPVHLCRGETVSDFLESGELKLTLICDEPRSMLFSTRIAITNTDPPLEEQTEGQASFSSRLDAIPRKHHFVGSLEVPEHYCKRRSSYCDQEEDEDKTDLESLSRVFPELRVLDYEDSPTCSGRKPTKPASLPLHEDNLTKLNTMTVTNKRTPLRLSPAPEANTPSLQRLAVTDWTTYQRLSSYNSLQSSRSTPLVTKNVLKGFARKPLFRPVTQRQCHIKSSHSNKGYSSIVSSRLTPYMK